jgi:nucleotide-binding universal stress UspA family protein
MYERILVPVDGSPTSDLGLQEAVRLAKLCNAQLRLVHVIDVLSLMAVAGEGFVGPTGDLLGPLRKGGEEILRKARDAVIAQGLAADTELFENTSGRIADIVIDEARRWKADLIVLGTHGRRGVQRVLLGSDAEQIVRQAPVPVLLVRAREAAAA